MPEKFSDQYKKEVDQFKAPSEALDKIRSKSSSRRSYVSWTRYAAIAAAAVIVLGGGLGLLLARGGRSASSAASTEMAAATASYDMATDSAAAPMEETAGETAAADSSVMAISIDDSDSTLYPAGDYAALYQVYQDRTGVEARDSGTAVLEAAAEGDTVAMADSAAEDNAGSGTDYSTTNVQVEGVDETDLLKTDGQYLYYLSGNMLEITSAQGKESTLLSSTAVSAGGLSGYDYYPVGLFLDGDRLTVLLSAYALTWDENAGSQNAVFALIYDISDRTAPKQVSLLGQSGSYTGSRMQDGVIYLVTTHYVWSTAREESPATYCPGLYTDTAYETVDAGSILISSHSASSVYTVVSMITPGAPESDRQPLAVLGAASTVYQSRDHLLLACTEYHSDQSDIAPDDQGRNVCISSHYSDTTLILIDTADGKLSLHADAVVEGYLDSSYAIDEQDGIYRIVTTADTSICRIYTDGIDTYEWEDSSYNCLFTLDADLNPVGSLTGLAEGEYVQSVRFDGDICYITTYRSVDPLFTVDLSDPANPKVLGTLEIPGFSDYMHTYTDGRLLGIGYQTDTATGWTQYVKLTMFDTTDKANVKELSTAVLKGVDWTLVGSCPQSVLVDAEKNIIAFPTEEGYMVYGWSEQNGFIQRAVIPVEDGLYGDSMRGAWVDDCFYVCTSTGVTVMDMTAFTVLKFVAFPQN